MQTNASLLTGLCLNLDALSLYTSTADEALCLACADAN
jgi:hypothetical protein